MSWQSPGRNLNIDPEMIRSLVVVGCGVEAYMFDDGPDHGGIIGYCASVCADAKENPSGPSTGANATSITAFLENMYRPYHFSMGDLLYETTNNNSAIGASSTIYLSVVVADQPNCQRARLDPKLYACGVHDCRDDETGGYICTCTNEFDVRGNPYLIGGCTEEYNPNQDKLTCSRSCGNTSIPFPFGLETGCSANKKFLLNCTSNQALIGTSPAEYQVTNISVGEGLLFVSKPLDLQDADTKMYAVHRNRDDWLTIRFIYDLADFDFSQQYGVWKWCEMAKKKDPYACVSAHSECSTVTHGQIFIGYRCSCSAGYGGNPYVRDGCRGATAGLTCGIGVLVVILGSAAFVRRWKIHIQKKTRRAYFKKNKGLLLEQLVSSDGSVSHSTKIFSLDELEKATNKFDSTRVVGRGGHSTVYKGILSDQRVIAIKKSQIIHQSEIDQFVNEVAILSQVNYRNVVKLFGCCLESEVPLLVYEFISNGALYDVLHSDLSVECLLSWDDRVRIAFEAASALAYLHSAASIPIFHRDIKSANTLLNDNFSAKVSDFGASRSIPIDETHVVTNIQETFGYLDPEYYSTGILTEKSDVYSFGVILVELLTRKKHVFLNCFGEKQNLCHYFLDMLRDKTAIEIVDCQVVAEASQIEIYEMASLAEICLRTRREDRPTMKGVEMKLQVLRAMIKSQPNAQPYNNDVETLLPSRSNLTYQTEHPNPSYHCEVTRCYTMEQELTSWADLPR
ncbi:hypothetical protein OsI_12324 [Oryza sativa Indica Group]|uniref:Protein kinase domain-containing protein n=1 Tax=Oryza sativa subsp. indica TaxID=39946 RepID=B8AL38_ORYSI|nr:hypothetical protein OsI_12324 [Oryza sativa Indica Group]